MMRACYVENLGIDLGISNPYLTGGTDDGDGEINQRQEGKCQGELCQGPSGGADTVLQTWPPHTDVAGAEFLEEGVGDHARCQLCKDSDDGAGKRNGSMHEHSH